MRSTKKRKRFLAFFLACIMILTSSPEGTAVAAEWFQEEQLLAKQNKTQEENESSPSVASVSSDIQELEKTAEEEMSSLEEIPILSEEEAQALASPSLEEREAEKLALVEAELNALEEQGESKDAYAPFLIIDNESEETQEHFLSSEEHTRSSNSEITPRIDQMVLQAQQWLNATYTGRHGYTPVAETGKTGNNVVKGLITALQIELGIAEPTGTFGPTTASLCPTLSTSSPQGNIVKILQYGLYCKGYQPRGTTGKFADGTKSAVMKVQTDAGLEGTGVVDPVLFKAILNTDALVLIANGDPKIRTMQQTLNRNYLAYIGIMPCDGVYGRNTNKALIYALQAEEGMPTSTANGNFGPSTTSLCPTLSPGDSRRNYVLILQYALYCNGYDPGTFDGVYDSEVSAAVSAFQSFMCLPVTGVANMPTIKALLCSSGDTNRAGTACDCSTIITAQTAQTIKANGYQIVGRYLTGTVGGTRSKAITKAEAQIIFDAGLKFFPIYQDGGYYLDYFTSAQGNSDAIKAVKAANQLGLPKGTIIYFAVDFDAYDYQVTSHVLPYFYSLSQRMRALGSPYRIGVYGPRNICTRVCENGYAMSSFVADMSTGYSGNLGYRMPTNWAFDQIKEYTIGSGSGAIAIDKNIASGRDPGVSYLSSYTAVEDTDTSTKVEDTYWADPIDISSGSHVIHQDMLTITGAQSVKFTLSYHSGNLAESEVGTGWYHNFQKQLEIGEESIKLYQTPATYLVYQPSEEPNVYTTSAPGKQNSRLEKQNDGSYRLINGVESIETFDAQGRYIAYETHMGMQIQIQYPSSQTIKIVEPISQDYILLTKNSLGKIISIQDKGGRSASLTYDSNGYLTQIEDVNGNTLTYTYNSEGKILTGTDEEGICYFTNTYDEVGRVISQKDGIANSQPTLFSYDDTSTEGRTIVEVTNRNGKERTNVFNESRQLIEVTDENGNTTSYTYDENGNVTSVTDGEDHTETTTYNAQNQPLVATDKMGNTTTNTYDSNGNVTAITYPNGATATYTYDSSNRMTGMTDIRGLVTTYEYNTQGLLTKKTEGTRVTTYTYENGRIKTITDPLNRVTTNTYNNKGQLIKSVDATGNTTTYTYDEKGKTVSITDALNQVTSFTYNSRDALQTSKDARQNTTTYAYNENGMLTSTTDAKGNTTTYEYDGEDRKVKTTDAAGNITQIGYDDAGRVISETDAKGNTTTYEYDGADHIVKETNALGGVITRTYNANGMVLTETDAAGNTTTYEYNAASLPVKITNAKGGITTYEYNLAGDLIKETDPNGFTQEYTYDSYGNKTSWKDANGNITTYTYDACNNLIQEKNPLNQVTTYTYDASNRLISITDALNHTTSMEYDAVGRVITVEDALGNETETEYDANGNVLAVIDALGNRTETTYDACNLITKETDALGNEKTYTYNAIGLLTKQTDELDQETTYTYDANQQLSSVLDALEGTSTQTYNAMGSILSMTGPTGAGTSYQYDIANRLTQETTPSNGTIQYGYNELNLQSEITNARGQERTYTCCGQAFL